MRISVNSAVVQIVNTMELRLGVSGYAELDSAWKSECLATPFNRLYLVESGQAHLYAGGEEIIMQPGHAYLLPAGLPCSYICQGSMRKLFFHFNIFKPDQYDLFHGLPKIAQLEISPQWLQELHSFYEGNRFFDGLQIKCFLYDLLRRFCGKYALTEETPAVYSAYVESTISYIRQNLSARLRVEELASRCFVSRTYLAEAFRKEVGITLGRYIDEQLINAAQWQLSQTDQSIEQISSALGFCNQFYFSKCFKKSCAISPNQFRKSMRYRM